MAPDASVRGYTGVAVVSRTLTDPATPQGRGHSLRFLHIDIKKRMFYKIFDLHKTEAQG